jgi:hypothetical protein
VLHQIGALSASVGTKLSSAGTQASASNSSDWMSRSKLFVASAHSVSACTRGKGHHQEARSREWDASASTCAAGVKRDWTPSAAAKRPSKLLSSSGIKDIPNLTHKTKREMKKKKK